ncbi:glutamate-1-semialdehyde 2,1-aminomutase [Meiothermus granaticius]|uniref:Glutamate-1-semialdehyde 2,1-aminomutase n=1 Tax=Meiothermus granaticius NBRC 107808 TaxID=1227551 RepID=A0A399FE71_9DEIN|nr:glutamate-1-semialdehyde 2,1-aminomutase [Meiothermus granaticius]RIH93779.1 Glutamate-1-semialdehyde 2,1-aminomutase [Meiothermus granaticius NBRC 107808]GEM85698.1 glutamate-1-semialdehyde 2,1-aminomutase [Meiothermus granaticius NBRC 107808]
MSTRTPLIQRSQELFERAQTVIPGGVNSPVRAFKAVGGTPRFIARAEGARLWDADGNELIDYLGSWGPMILGHKHPKVQAALRAALEEGTSYGAPTEREVRLAELVLQAYPSCDMVRFVSSGTEATMSALRLARGYTGRDRIVKFRGNYHGHADGLLVQAGSGLLTAGGGSARSAPSSAGVPQAFAELTLVADYNDPESLEALFASQGPEIAAVIFEPVVGNAGVLIPTPEFLEALQGLTRAHGALLIADEVMTGFRLAPGGAVERLGLEPDLVCWGKIIGGGLPVGAYGGKREIMEQVAPSGPVYQAGTLSGNPIAMAAGIATLEALAEHPPYAQLEAYGQALQTGLEEIARSAGVPATLNRAGSMITLFFREGPVQTYAEAVGSDTEAFKRFFHGLLEQGIYWPPSQFEAAFFSAAHGEAELKATLEAAEAALRNLAAGR